MKILQLRLNGRIPSKKNSRITQRSTGRSFASAKYKDWHKQSALQLLGSGKIVGACEVQITFQMPDNRRADLTNKAESIMDLLVDLDILEDDSWKIIPRIFLGCDGVNKDNPGADIWLRQLI